MQSAFEYRAPTEEERQHLAILQQGWLYIEGLINEHVPPGGERALAITKLQECRFWSNAGVVLVNKEADGRP